MLVVGLIKEKSIKTTVQKAKVARQLAEKLVTAARANRVSARRRVAARLGDAEAVKRLFEEVVPMLEGRPGGFTRITKLGQRPSDGSEMCILAWVSEKYEPKADEPETEVSQEDTAEAEA